MAFRQLPVLPSTPNFVTNFAQGMIKGYDEQEQMRQKILLAQLMNELEKQRQIDILQKTHELNQSTPENVIAQAKIDAAKALMTQNNSIPKIDYQSNGPGQPPVLSFNTPGPSQQMNLPAALGMISDQSMSPTERKLLDLKLTGLGLANQGQANTNQMQIPLAQSEIGARNAQANESRVRADIIPQEFAWNQEKFRQEQKLANDKLFTEMAMNDATNATHIKTANIQANAHLKAARMQLDEAKLATLQNKSTQLEASILGGLDGYNKAITNPGTDTPSQTRLKISTNAAAPVITSLGTIVALGDSGVNTTANTMLISKAKGMLQKVQSDVQSTIRGAQSPDELRNNLQSGLAPGVTMLQTDSGPTTKKLAYGYMLGLLKTPIDKNYQSAANPWSIAASSMPQTLYKEMLYFNQTGKLWGEK